MIRSTAPRSPSLLALLLLPCLLMFAACDGGTRPVLALDGRTMGTSWSLRISDPPETLREAELRERIEARLARVNALMSTYDPDSQLSRFNASESGQWFPVDPELLAVVRAARELARITDGAFDPTVAPLVDLWGFGAGSVATAEDRVPSEAAIADAMAQVGWGRVEVREAPPALRKSGPVHLDLSAIAKGYGVDAMAMELESLGIGDYLVEIGGELRVLGENPRDIPWQVGIEVPDPARRGVSREAIGLTAGAVATSGDYRNYFVVDGVRYSHTIDPATGRPVRHRVASVTVVHGSAMWADGLATALNVMGPEAGLALARERSLPVSFILYADGGLVERSSEPFAEFRSDDAR